MRKKFYIKIKNGPQCDATIAYLKELFKSNEVEGKIREKRAPNQDFHPGCLLVGVRKNSFYENWQGVTDDAYNFNELEKFGNDILAAIKESEPKTYCLENLIDRKNKKRWFIGKCGDGPENSLYGISFKNIFLVENPIKTWSSEGCNVTVEKFVDVEIKIKE